MILLDTNVLSELARPAPSPAVLAWIAARNRSDLASTTITEAELRFGLALLPDGARRAALTVAVERLLAEGLGGRILPFDRLAAQAYAGIAAARRAAGRPVGTADAQIAAIARACGASLATRNVADFIDCGVAVIDPWQGRA